MSLLIRVNEQVYVSLLLFNYTHYYFHYQNIIYILYQNITINIWMKSLMINQELV